MENSLKVLMLSAEISPFVKTGGVADVVGELPRALRALGHDVRVAMREARKIYIGPKTIVTPSARELAAASDILVLAQR